MKVGIIGCGKQAYKHIDGLKAYSNNIEIWVSDLNREAAVALSDLKKVNTASSVAKIISSPDISAVLICTPPDSHYELVMQALESGKHVFCEKPLCKTKKQAEAIADRSVETGCFVQVGYVYRYVPVFVKLKALLADLDQPLGEGVSAIFRIGGRGSHQVWKHLKAKGGGATNEMLVHMLDLACWLFGPISNFTWLERKLLRPQREINGVLETVDAEDYVVASCQSSRGVSILFQADMLTPAFRQSLEFQGTNGSFVGSIQSDVASYVHLISNQGNHSSGRNELNLEQVNLFHQQMSAFLNNVTRGELQEGAAAQNSIQLFDFLSE